MLYQNKMSFISEINNKNYANDFGSITDDYFFFNNKNNKFLISEIEKVYIEKKKNIKVNFIILILTFCYIPFFFTQLEVFTKILLFIQATLFGYIGYEYKDYKYLLIIKAKEKSISFKIYKKNKIDAKILITKLNKKIRK